MPFTKLNHVATLVILVMAQYEQGGASKYKDAV